MLKLHRHLDRGVASSVALAALVAQGAAWATTPPCMARSGPHAPAVVELYTSEGCNSCPPAERWVSGLKGSPDVIALAFHVDYWDAQGWKDRFAQHAFSQRQAASIQATGAKFAYTPQVVVDGRDTPSWEDLKAAGLAAKHDAAAPVDLQLAAQGPDLELTVTPAAAAPARFSGYVAVVDDGLSSRPIAGENRGVKLREDSVVRELLPWNAASDAPKTLHFTPTSTPEDGATRRYVAVATTADGARPLQAVALACAR